MVHSSASLVPEVPPLTPNIPSVAKTTAPFWFSFWRLLLALSLATGAILTTVVASVPSAYAAAAAEAAAAAQTSLPPTYSGVRNPTRNVPVPTSVHDTSSHISPFKPKQTQSKVATPAASSVSSGTPLNGLGDSSLYTFIDKSLSDHLDLKVNVANGNLVLHTVELQITGRGLNNTIGGYYNSQSNWWLDDHGTNWNFTTGRGASLYLDDLSTTGAITLNLSTGLKAYLLPMAKAASRMLPA